MLLEQLLSCEVITRMLLGRIFGDTHVEAHHTLTCVPLNVIHVKTSLVIDSLSVSSRRRYSGCEASLTLRQFDLFSCYFCLAGGFSS